MPTPEGVVLAEVIAFCAKVPGLRLTRNMSGTIKARGRVYRFGCFTPGGPDLLGWYTRNDDGTNFGDLAVFVAIEVKAPGGADEVHYSKTLLAQRAFLKEAVAAGCIAGVVHSVEECAALLGLKVNP